jgi:hypothetical protein
MILYSNYFKEMYKQIRIDLKERLSRRTENERILFNKMYPMGIDKIPLDKLDWCFKQIENTEDK